MLKALIPIDGSEFSNGVFETIKKMLSPKVFSLTLLEVAPIPEELEEIKNGVPATWAAQIGYTIASPETRRALEPERSAYVERIWKSYERVVLDKMDSVKHNLERAGFTVEALVRFGEPAEEISDCVKYGHMDLVVMATHGRSGISRVVMGSVAEKVLRSLHIPVMMVRPEAATADEWTPVLDMTEIADAIA
jgi:nucleotide-binding universal stress UspA family protein